MSARSTERASRTSERGSLPDQAASHLLVLCFCLGLLAIAVLLARFDTGGEKLALGSVELPGVCAFNNATGLPCPGCGLTRSWVALAAGDLQRSLSRHRLGWLFMLYALLQAVRHAAWLVLPAAQARLSRPGVWLDRGLVVIGVLLMLNWPLTLWLRLGAP